MHLMFFRSKFFDKLNQYTFAETREVGDIWQKAINDKERRRTSQDEREKIDKVVDEYRTLSDCLLELNIFH